MRWCISHITSILNMNVTINILKWYNTLALRTSCYRRVLPFIPKSSRSFLWIAMKCLITEILCYVCNWYFGCLAFAFILPWFLESWHLSLCSIIYEHHWACFATNRIASVQTIKLQTDPHSIQRKRNKPRNSWDKIVMVWCSDDIQAPGAIKPTR